MSLQDPQGTDAQGMLSEELSDTVELDKAVLRTSFT